MLYIFFTNTIGGCSGGATYIRNKLNWLRNNNWKVVVFDTGGQINEKILLKELLPFKNNHIYELYYHPCYFTVKKREKVIKKIIQRSKQGTQIVIESNTITLSEWGELVASRLNAKHLIYLIQENLIISSEEQYAFLKYKADNNELFSINATAYKMLFSKYEDVNAPEMHYWQASNASPIIDVENKVINSLPSADITISHFGRKKNYFDYMIKEVEMFAQRHSNKQINFVLLGINSFSQNQNYVNNLKVFPIGNHSPIPASFYKVSDVVIATAGCASMSFKYGAKVVSMDTSNEVPLGVLGYTTLDRTYRSSDNKNNKHLSELLEEILIENKYNYDAPMTIPESGKSYDYHISFVGQKPAPYYDTSNTCTPTSFKEKLNLIILKMGFVKIRTYLRYYAFRNLK